MNEQFVLITSERTRFVEEVTHKIGRESEAKNMITQLMNLEIIGQSTVGGLKDEANGSTAKAENTATKRNHQEERLSRKHKTRDRKTK
jgi:hypothetical protein